MKQKSLIWLSFLVIAVAATVFVVSCSKKFDQPPSAAIPSDVVANTTIKAFKARHAAGGFEAIVGDTVIKGIVVGNDSTGNIYKTIYLQDATGGIAVSLEASSLYGQFPVGREVAIKCKGLYLSDYGKTIQLGYIDRSIPTNPTLTGIPTTLWGNYIYLGSVGNYVAPKVVTIAQINAAATMANSDPKADTLQSTLIQIASAQFSTYANLIYSDTTANKSSVSRTIADCNNNTSVVYTSGYANFAGVSLPSGNGTLTAIYIPFRNTSELLVRDTSDVKFTAGRCGSNATPITIAQLRAMYAGSNVTLGSVLIRGVVISDAANKNINAGNMVLQQASSGIDLYFGTAAATTNFNVGDSVEVNLTGGILQSYNGMIEVSLSSSALPAAALATGKVITPAPTTIAQLNANINTIENTLIRIVSATASPAGTYSGNKTLTDATGTVTLYTNAGANFSGSAISTTCQNWVGIPSRFTTNQFQIRNTTDVTTGTGCSTGTTAPVVTTTAVSAIAATTAASGGNVTSDGGATVTARGVVWSTSTAPTIALSTKTSDGTGTGSFTSSITGLTSGTTYYVRAYATNSVGTSYGSEVSFTAGGSTGTTSVTEDFESGTKSSYAAASVTLTTGSWTFSDAIIGTPPSATGDVANGIKAARIRGTVGSNNGYIETEFGYNGLKTVTILHAQTNFTEPAGATPSFELYVSKNGGAWTKVGNTTSSIKGTFTTTAFTVNAASTENVKVRILNTSSANATNQVRLDIDDVKFDY